MHYENGLSSPQHTGGKSSIGHSGRRRELAARGLTSAFAGRDAVDGGAHLLAASVRVEVLERMPFGGGGGRRAASRVGQRVEVDAVRGVESPVGARRGELRGHGGARGNEVRRQAFHSRDCQMRRRPGMHDYVQASKREDEGGDGVGGGGYVQAPAHVPVVGKTSKSDVQAGGACGASTSRRGGGGVGHVRGVLPLDPVLR